MEYLLSRASPPAMSNCLGRALSDSNSSIACFDFSVFTVIWEIWFSLKANPNSMKRSDSGALLAQGASLRDTNLSPWIISSLKGTANNLGDYRPLKRIFATMPRKKTCRSRFRPTRLALQQRRSLGPPLLRLGRGRLAMLHHFRRELEK
jgi:hypothetical protein